MLKKLVRKAGPVLIFSEHMDGADGTRMFHSSSFNSVLLVVESNASHAWIVYD